MSDVPTPVGEAGARALGFGDTLDLYTRSFTASFAWTPDALATGAQPVRGYASTTSVTMGTSLAGFVHLVPQLGGCADHLRVTLHVSLTTADGAIAVAGDVTSDAQRDPKDSAFGFGRLDLHGARGSLQLFPPAQSDLVGYLAVLLTFTPEAVRGDVYVEFVVAGTADSDYRFGYRPLEGKFPNDDCFSFQRPVSTTDSSVTPRGSTLAFDDELNAVLQSQHSGTWSSGGETSVSATIGVPSSLCVQPTTLQYPSIQYPSIPFRVLSADGRVNIEGTAHGGAIFGVNGAPDSVWFESYENATKPEDFAGDSGISGLDLSDYSLLLWTLELRPFDPDPGLMGGSLLVEGVHADNTLNVIEMLTWH